jgi:putative membrane protein
MMSGAAGLALVLAAAPMSALRAQITQAPTNQPRAQAVSDTAFIREARAANLLEVMLGQQAGKKASSSAVKQFAERMVTDHTKMGNDWAALAPKTGPTISSPLTSEQRATVTRLDGLKGTEYDREYMTTMVEDHQQDVATFQRLGPSAQSPDVRQLASSSLATMEEHLSMARQVAAQVGANPSVVTGPSQAPGRRPGEVTTGPGQVTRRTTEAASRELKDDEFYVNEVSQGHIMEVELAQRASRNASDPKVKKFAENLLDDFTKWRDRWVDLATRAGVTNVHMGPKHKEKVDRLDNASRGQFDRVYLDIVTENLGSMVPYFQKEGREAHAAQVRNLVNDELPTLQQHLARAEDLGKQLHAETGAEKKSRSVSSKR